MATAMVVAGTLSMALVENAAAGLIKTKTIHQGTMWGEATGPNKTNAFNKAKANANHWCRDTRRRGSAYEYAKLGTAEEIYVTNVGNTYYVKIWHTCIQRTIWGIIIP